MSLSNIDAFHAKLTSDPALLDALKAGVTTQAEFTERAVVAGREAGLAFSAAEFVAWTEARATVNEGELSDAQLETIAGGFWRPLGW